jgi:hypothetical protein
MSQNEPVVALAIEELPTVVVQLFERVGQPLLPGTHGQPRLFVRYLRRKPGRGLAVVYNASPLNSSRGTRSRTPERWVSLTLGEAALEGTQISFAARQAQEVALEAQPPGILRVADLDLVVQAFPADDGLPGLAASCTTAQDGPLFSALEAAARIQLCDPAWHLVSAKAEPVRYKPSSRCVIRYTLLLERTTTEGRLQRHLALFGKVYGDREQARTIHAAMQQLYTEQAAAGQPILPRPLGAVERLGLTLNEAVESPEGTEPEPLRTGLHALQARVVRGGAGETLDVVIPGTELRLAAHALARLHTSAARPAGALRTGAKEAKRARERAALIAAHDPAQADAAQRLAAQLATRLEALEPDAYRPAHGGFKASQLLFHGQRVFVVDFDGFCRADPALDVGYFLAYLRPSGLWYRRPSLRRWFEGSAACFVNAYRQAARERGIGEATIDGILQRTCFYEAAFVFKIATRRVNRLNSPRAGELSTMLAEIATCLSSEARECRSDHFLPMRSLGSPPVAISSHR